MNVLLLLLSIAIGNSLILERNSPGLVPSMHSNDVNEYAPDLTFVASVRSYPLLNSASALTVSPAGDLLIAEPCGTVCSQITRYTASGDAAAFGRPIIDAVRAMEFLPSGDLIVLLSGSLTRLDAKGRPIGATPLPMATPVYGFDVDRDQCTAVFTALDRIGITNICSSDPVTQMLPVPGNAFDVRFAPDGDILAAAGGAVYELDRRGAIVRSFITDGVSAGRLAIDPDGTSFQTTGQNRLYRFDIGTGEQLAPSVMLRSAAYGAISMAIRGEWRAAMHLLPRRRSVLR